MTPPLPPLHAVQVQRVGSVFLRRRPWVVAALVAWTLGVLVVGGAPSRQVLALAIGMGAGLAFFTVEALVARRRPVRVTWLFSSLVVTLVALTLGCVVTGGVGGPLVPMLFAPVGVGFAAFGAGPRGLTLWGLCAVAVLVLLAVPVGTPFAPLAPGPFRFVAAGAVMASLSLLFLGVGTLATAHAEASVTALTAAEEVVAASRARVRWVEELGGHFAHALKNPLAAIKALLDVEAERASDPRTVQRLQVVRGEVDRMTALVRAGLDLSRPLAGAERAPADPESLARRQVSVLEPLAAQKGIRLEAHGESAGVRLDAPRVTEALFNLLLNALEATDAGGQVSLRWRPHAGGVAFEVTDTGRGMDAEALARVGTPFFTTRESGTGLGVALARQVAAQHGGTLTFTSEPGHGTTARLELPAEAAS